MKNRIHIISFDIPYPANYGGVIDVFHKIRCLHQVGFEVILHCFQYGNKKTSSELESLCFEVHYYKRNLSFINQLSNLPFNVKSRIDKQLKQNLIKDNYPILFEVLHSCYLLGDVDLKTRIKLFRHSNIEHEYFFELANVEKSIFKKIYLMIEAIKLKKFEKQITYANCILSVSEKDLVYFKNTYPATPSVYLPSFHAFDKIKIKEGIGDYILYHANLSVSENENAVIWLIDHVFSKINYPVIIAGLNPSVLLEQKISKYHHIQLEKNCSDETMNLLIANAHIHCLYTGQTTGLKLKLLHVLFSGRHVLANNKMLYGTQLSDACCVCDIPDDYIKSVNQLISTPFTKADIEKRQHSISTMSNLQKTNRLLEIINSYALAPL